MIAALTLLLAGCLNYGAVSSGPQITRHVVRFQVYFIVQIRLYIYLYRIKTTFRIIFFRNGEPALSISHSDYSFLFYSNLNKNIFSLGV